MRASYSAHHLRSARLRMGQLPVCLVAEKYALMGRQLGSTRCRRTARRRAVAARLGNRLLLGGRNILVLNAPFSSLDVGRIVRIVRLGRVVTRLFELDQFLTNLLTRHRLVRLSERNHRSGEDGSDYNSLDQGFHDLPPELCLLRRLTHHVGSE